MSFRLHLSPDVRSDLKSIAGIVAVEQASNPAFIVGGGITGPTGPSSITNPVFTDVLVTNNITGYKGVFNNLSVNNNSNNTTTFLSSTSLSGNISLTLPPNIPAVSKSYWTTDSSGNITLDPLLFPVSNLKEVSKNPIDGQFSTIESAISAINSSVTPPSATNPYLVLIDPGLYSENLLTIPSFVTVAGRVLESVIVSANGSHNVFSMPSGSSLYNLIISDAPLNGVYITDATSESVLIHKVSFRTCSMGIRISANINNSQVYLEYCDFKNCDNDIYMDDSTFNNFLSAENNFITHEQSPITSSSIRMGTNCSIYYFSGSIIGNSNTTGVGVDIFDNASCVLKNTLLKNYNVAIQTSVLGTPNLTLDGISASNNTYDVIIGGAGTTGYLFGPVGVSKTIIPNDAPFYIYGTEYNTYTVAKKGGDFSTISDAINFITDSSISNNYIINVNPGEYLEPPLFIPEGVIIMGSSEQACRLKPLDNDSNFITTNGGNSLNHLEIFGPTSINTASIYNKGDGVLGLTFLVQNCILRSSNRFFTGDNSVGSSITIFENTTTSLTDDILNEGFVVSSIPGPNFTSFAYSVSVILLNSISTVFDISGENTNAVISNVLSQSIVPGSTFLREYNGANVTISSCKTVDQNIAISLPNIGVGSIINCQAIQCQNCNTDLLDVHPSTAGLINGVMDINKVSILSPDLSLQIYNRSNTVMLGNLIIGSNFSNLVDSSKSIQYSTNLGIITNPDVIPFTISNLTASVGTGSGYVSLGNIPNDTLKYVTWDPQNVSLIPNTLNHLYIDQNGILNTSLSDPSDLNVLNIGNSYTDSGSSLYTQNSGNISTYLSSFLNTYNNALGPIVTAGLIATPNSNTGTNVNVSSGQFYYSSHSHSLPQENVITMITVYRNGSGGYVLNTTTNVSDMYDDNSGVLQPIPVSNYVKHNLYEVDNEGVPTFLLVYGQEIFTSLAEAQVGSSPTQPSFIQEDVVLIAGVIVINDPVYGPAIPNPGGIIDQRPTLSFKSGTVTATSDHNSLSNLTVGDAHTQYFRTDGTRVLSGSLQLGGNTITGVNSSVNNIIDTNTNGMNVFSHASRHLTNGSDPLSVGVPVSIGTANSLGIAHNFSLSDHVHNHDNQPGGTLHSAVTTVSNGFMTSVDKIKLDSATGISVANTIMTRDSNSSVSVNSITGSNCIFTNILTNSFTGTNIAISNITGSSAVITNILNTSFTGTNATISNINSTTNITGVRAAISSFTGSSATITNILTNSFIGTNAAITNITGAFANITSFTGSSAVITNILNTSFTGTNAAITNITGAFANITSFTGSSATITNILNTSFTGTNAAITNITGAFANITSFTGSSAVITNILNNSFTGTNAAITNITGSSGAFGTLSMDHIVGRTSVPVLTVGAGIVVSSSSISGTDISGNIQFVVTNGTSNGIAFTITFNIPHSIAPKCVILSPANSASASVPLNQIPFVSIANITTGSFIITQNTTRLANGTYAFYYLVL